MSDSDRAIVVERYAKRLEQYGVDLRTLNVGKHYAVQHAVHATVGDLRDKTLLDIGCGLAHYYEYLLSRGIRTRYIGYDIVAPFIEIDRERFPEATFDTRDVTNEPILHEPDYVVMCQVFNNRYVDSDNTAVVQSVIRKAFDAARIGVSVDMLSTCVNFQEPQTAYFDPLEMFAFGKSVAPFVRLAHDYAPHHFTLFLLKEAYRPERA